MASKLRIQSGAGPDVEWRPDVFHRVHPDLVGQKKHWWAQMVQGIYLLGDDLPLRTRGKPTTIERVMKNLGDLVHAAVDVHGLVLWEPSDVGLAVDGAVYDWNAARMKDLEILVVAVLANENGGKLRGDRYEPHINDWSFGPAQFLTSTAQQTAKTYQINTSGLPPQTMRQNDSALNKRLWKAYLEDPSTAAQLEVCYLCHLSKQFDLKGDPVLTYASYNAGSPRPSRRRTPWVLVAYDKDGLGPLPGALDHFAKWYGDACAVMR